MQPCYIIKHVPKVKGRTDTLLENYTNINNLEILNFYAEKTNTFVSQHKTAGQNCNIKVANKSLQNVSNL